MLIWPNIVKKNEFIANTNLIASFKTMHISQSPWPAQIIIHAIILDVEINEKLIIRDDAFEIKISIIFHFLITCSDRHIYWVNRNKPIIEINISYKISINYCSIKMQIIPCSDRDFYCVNFNKCDYWEQYFI